MDLTAKEGTVINLNSAGINIATLEFALETLRQHGEVHIVCGAVCWNGSRPGISSMELGAYLAGVAYDAPKYRKDAMQWIKFMRKLFSRKAK